MNINEILTQIHKRKAEMLENAEHDGKGGATMVTMPCPVCGECGEYTVRSIDLLLYKMQGGSIQECFPYLLPAEREQILNGFCPECQDKAFGDDE